MQETANTARVSKSFRTSSYGEVVATKKRREITVETERLLIIRRRYRAVEAWCEGCGEETVMVRPDQAAAATGRSLRAIFADIEASALHFLEQPDGMLLICLNSLLGQKGQLRLPEDEEKEQLP